MATITLQRAKCVKTISGNAPESLVFPEAANQSLKAGQVVYVVSGKVTECASDATSIAGMAVADASTVTDTDCEIYVANSDSVFEMNVYHATPGSAITAVTTPTTAYGIVVANNKCYVDIAEVTATSILVRNLSELDAVGDTYGRIHGQVLTDIRQLDSREKTA